MGNENKNEDSINTKYNLHCLQEHERLACMSCLDRLVYMNVLHQYYKVAFQYTD